MSFAFASLRNVRRLAAALLAAASVVSTAGLAHAGDQPAWPDTPATRLAVLALIETLNAEVLASRSATLTIEKWCADHRLAAVARISAHLIRGVDKPPSAEQRQRLGIGADEPVRYRRVELWCGEHILSIADNWYVPARLTDAMNRLLDTTDTPFGKAVLALAPTRHTFAVNLLWSPLPAGWELGAPVSKAGPSPGTLAIPDALFEHRALLTTKDNLPFSEVDEVYQRGILAFPAPSL